MHLPERRSPHTVVDGGGGGNDILWRHTVSGVYKVDEKMGEAVLNLNPLSAGRHEVSGELI